MKRIILLIMILILAISMAACGNAKQTETNSGNDSQSEQEEVKSEENEKIRFMDLDPEERLFVQDYGALIIRWFTTKNDSLKWLSLEGVYEDEEGNQYMDLIYKDKEALVQIYDGLNSESVIREVLYLPENISKVPLDTETITEYLSNMWE